METIKPIFVVILLFMTVSGSVAALFLKRASALKSLREMLCNPNIYIGGGLYLVCAVLNIYLLRKADYSVVLPLTSVTYVWTMLLSYFILKEKLTVKKIIGVIGIIFGALLVALQ